MRDEKQLTLLMRTALRLHLRVEEEMGALDRMGYQGNLVRVLSTPSISELVLNVMMIGAEIEHRLNDDNLGEHLNGMERVDGAAFAEIQKRLNSCPQCHKPLCDECHECHECRGKEKHPTPGALPN